MIPYRYQIYAVIAAYAAFGLWALNESRDDQRNEYIMVIFAAAAFAIAAIHWEVFL